MRLLSSINYFFKFIEIIKKYSTMNVCFIMYFWEDIDPENDTSLA